MKKVFGILILMVILVALLSSNCRPPELEGIAIDINQGLYDKAYDLAKEAVVKYPNNPEAWYRLGEVEGYKEMFADMNESFDKSLAISQQFAPQINQFRTKYFAENYNNALKSFYNPAIKEQDPQKKKELFCKAADKFLNAHLSDPNRVEPLSPMANSYLQCGDTATAEKYLDQAIEAKPKDDTLLVTVGDFYYNADKLDKAEELYNKALSINSDNADALLALGEIYSKRDQMDKAIELFKKGMELEPNNANIPMNIGILLYNNEKYQEAIPYLKKTIEMVPDNRDMYELLSISYMQIAQKNQEKFNETQDPQYQQKAAAIYDEALPFLEDAVQRFPDDALLVNNLGIVYAQKNMKEKAQEMFERQKQLEDNQ
jgi:tetratricopeptide (TPR) repeat protein